MLLAQPDVGLLQSPGGDQGIDLIALNAVQFLNGALDLPLVRTDVHNEYKSVAVLDQLHTALSGEGVFNEAVLIKRVLLGC